jgi:outer membrane protein assembly factor BamE
MLLLAAGCSFHMPRVAHVPVQQGNVITQAMVDKLKIGMTRRQVAFVMGEPVLRNTFDTNRWEYVHSYQVGEVQVQEIHMTLLFNEDALASISGDLKPAGAATPPANDSEFDSPENNPVIDVDPAG